LIGLSITGLVDVQRMFEKLGDSDIFNETMEAVAQDAYNLARDKYVPVYEKDGGTLRDSIFYECTKETCVLGATAPYAVWNEYGSIHSPLGPGKKCGQRPFLRPAMIEARNHAQDFFNKKMYRILNLK
jgi:phage gpG-like protein